MRVQYLIRTSGPLTMFILKLLILKGCIILSINVFSLTFQSGKLRMEELRETFLFQQIKQLIAFILSENYTALNFE